MNNLVWQGNADNPLYAEKIPVTIRLVSPAGLVEGEVLHQMERAVNEQKIMEIPKQPPREAALKELVEERFAYQYPYEEGKTDSGKGYRFPAEEGRDGGIRDRKRAVRAGRTRTNCAWTL